MPSPDFSSLPSPMRAKAREVAQQLEERGLTPERSRQLAAELVQKWSSERAPHSEDLDAAVAEAAGHD